MANDIARALGGFTRHGDYFESDEYVLSSAIGHLLELVAPEFQIVTETSVSGYLNFMQGAIRHGLWVNAPDLPYNASNANNGFDITCTYASLQPLATDAAALVRKVALLLSAGQVGAATQARIVSALNATPLTDASSASARLNRIAAAVLLVMCCPEYLVQK